MWQNILQLVLVVIVFLQCWFLWVLWRMLKDAGVSQSIPKSPV